MPPGKRTLNILIHKKLPCARDADGLRRLDPPAPCTMAARRRSRRGGGRAPPWRTSGEGDGEKNREKRCGWVSNRCRICGVPRAGWSCVLTVEAWGAGDDPENVPVGLSGIITGLSVAVDFNGVAFSRYDLVGKPSPAVSAGSQSWVALAKFNGCLRGRRRSWIEKENKLYHIRCLKLIRSIKYRLMIK